MVSEKKKKEAKKRTEQPTGLTDRAQVVSITTSLNRQKKSKDMAPQRRKSKRLALAQARNQPGKSRRRISTKRGENNVRIVKGRVALKVAGYPGYQKLTPGQLVRHVPISKLRLAAKRILEYSMSFKPRGKGSNSNDRRKAKLENGSKQKNKKYF